MVVLQSKNYIYLTFSCLKPLIYCGQNHVEIISRYCSYTPIIVSPQSGARKDTLGIRMPKNPIPRKVNSRLGWDFRCLGKNFLKKIYVNS